MALVKREVLDKSIKMFLRYGIQSVTMDDIANNCGMSKRTLYKMFKNKDKLLGEAMQLLIEGLKQSLSVIHTKSNNALVELLDFLNVLDDFFKQSSPVLIRDIRRHDNLFIQINHLKSILIVPFIRENLKRGLKEKLYKSNLTISKTVESFISIVSLLFSQNKHQNNLEFNNNLSFFFNLFVHGVLSEKGVDLLKEMNNNI